MKRGFTLIELLIVMVIVVVLVTVALPKYNAALERARAQEGISNIKAAVDVLNTRYVMNGGRYTENGGGVLDSNGHFLTGNFMKPKYFTLPWAVRGYEGGLQHEAHARYWDPILGQTVIKWEFDIFVDRMEGTEAVYRLGSLATRGDWWPAVWCTPLGTNDGSVCDAAGFHRLTCFQDDINEGRCTSEDYLMYIK